MCATGRRLRTTYWLHVRWVGDGLSSTSRRVSYWRDWIRVWVHSWSSVVRNSGCWVPWMSFPSTRRNTCLTSRWPRRPLGIHLGLCLFDLIQLWDNYLYIMGCLASQKKIEDRLTPRDYKVLWKKCLKIEGVTISPQKRREHPVFEQIAKDINRTFPNHEYFVDAYNKKRF